MSNHNKTMEYLHQYPSPGLFPVNSTLYNQPEGITNLFTFFIIKLTFLFSRVSYESNHRICPPRLNKGYRKIYL